jgi:peptide/nickel transport system substrate-binding protein
MLASGCTDREATQTQTTTAAPTPTTTGNASAPSERPLRVSFTSSPGQFDPARMATVEAFHLAFAIYDALIWIDRELTAQPLLALSWQTSADQLAWTFDLRQDVKFHNGADLTAKDVVYTFTRLTDPSLNSSLFSILRIVQSIEAVDDYTVRFMLSAPNAEFPLLLGAPQAGIVPDQSTTADLATKPVGTGPFQFVESIPGERISMLRFADYWNAEGYTVDELEYVYLPSFSAQANALINGEVDIVPDINIQDLSKLIDHPTVDVMEVPSGRYQTIVMQATEAPFTDLHVRQALKLCADRHDLQEAVLQGHGSPGSDHPVSSVSPFWAEDLPVPERNINQARQLLTAAGYPNGLKLSLITSASRPGMVELATAFRDMARPAGIEIDVVSVPADVYWTDYGGKVPFHIGNWNSRPSIDETLTLGYYSQSQQNESRWQNARLDAIIEEARAEGDFEARKALYREAQMLIMTEGAVIIPYFRPVLMATSLAVQGFEPHPSGWLDFHEVTLNV